MDYISRLKQLKADKKMTNESLAEITGIPLSTISKIFAGISDSPKLSNMVLIANALDSTLDYIVSGTPKNNNNYTLSKEEISLVENYRQLDRHGKELIGVVMQKEFDRVGVFTETNSFSNVGLSNSVSSEKTAKILSAPKARYNDIYSETKKKSVLLYDLPVSAGPGVYLDDSLAETISIPVNEKTERATFALKVKGDSMEPRYYDGDVLLVEDTSSVGVGELGIFILDGNGYFKRFGGDRLVSINPKYDDILLKNYVEAVCCGRVVGRLKKK
jgi:SOS-response transcriptional repressor LexA/DNA-binding Xre family transcriptional regulator